MITLNWTIFFLGSFLGGTVVWLVAMAACSSYRRSVEDLQKRLDRKDQVIAELHRDLILARGRLAIVDPCKCDNGNRITHYR